MEQHRRGGYTLATLNEEAKVQGWCSHFMHLLHRAYQFEPKNRKFLVEPLHILIAVFQSTSSNNYSIIQRGSSRRRWSLWNSWVMETILILFFDGQMLGITRCRKKKLKNSSKMLRNSLIKFSFVFVLCLSYKRWFNI